LDRREEIQIMSVLKWIKEKYTQRRAGRDDHDPWWVTLMLDVGRPLIAVLILTMCAPGEHYLAMEAGWSETLAWGMPGTLTAYAGIAAVVATKRPKGAPGRTTAIAGAIVSIALAMAAQPIAHLYGRHGLNHQTIFLTVVAGLIPAAVFGHLLHMGAAAPKPERAPEADVPDKTAGQSGGHGIPVSEFLAERGLRPELGLSEYATERGQTDRTPQWLTDNRTEADRLGVSVSEIMSAPDSPPDMAVWTGQPDTDMDIHGLSAPDTRTEDLDTLVSEIPIPVRPRLSNVRSIKKGTLSADVRTYMSEHPDADDSDLAAAMSIKWPDKPWDSVRKARDRFKETQERSS
jgi:hypothetical protein